MTPGEPRPTVVILAWHSRSDLPETLAALRATRGGAPDLLVVDNACPERSADLVPEFYPGAEVVRSVRNLGFAGGADLALRHLLSRGVDEALFLNADARPEPDWLDHLRAAAVANPDAGVLGALVVNGEGTDLDPYQRALLKLNELQEPTRDAGPVEIPMVIGAAFWLRGFALRSVGGFDPLFFAYGEETDLCRRVRHRGDRVLLVPPARVRHSMEGSSRTPWRKLRVSWLRARAEGLLHLKRPSVPLRTGVTDLPFRIAAAMGRDLAEGRPIQALIRLTTGPALLARLPDIHRSRVAEETGPAHVVVGP